MARILIIDDEADFCFFVKSTLELSGEHNVAMATSGAGGIKAALRYKPDLILLDMMMPKMNGFEVLRRLKENKKTMSIPVLILTAKDDGSIEQAVRRYCENYIVKPIEMVALQSKIEAALSSYRTRSGHF